MSIRRKVVTLCAAATLAACSFDAVNFSLSNTLPDGPLVERCDTPGDEDGNGLADCADPACAAEPSCQVRCGNGKVEAGEACDDGNTTDGDACESDCTLPTCGNSIIDISLGEICDPPTPGTCSPDCRSLLQCGNGVIDPGEECDNGLSNNGNDKDCRSDCVINRCGDGRANTNGTHHEDCDAAPLTSDHIRTAVPTETATCNSDCTAPRCGDGKVNGHFKPAGAVATEQCDIGTANNDGADCTATCQVGVCGDGHVNTIGPLHGEGCDRALTPATCNLDCTASRCGDGKLNALAVPAEQCDDANTFGGDGCSATCRFEHCGNGVVDVGEDCDGPIGLQPCSASCRQERCGNGILDVDPGNGIVEQCDDGNTANNDGCSSSCRFERCGDGIKNGAEQCDDGNTVNGDGCENDCTTSVCGNGIVDAGEVCDDGNTLACGSCSASCLTVTSSPATGAIFAAPGNAYVTNDNFVLSDGLSTSVTFDFTNGTPVAGHIAIRFTASDTAQTVATAIANAVLGSGRQLTAVAVNGVVLLQHQRPTSRGNIGISESVASPAFAAFGMTGGKGGDCAANIGCADNDDCASHVCSFGRCQ